MKMSSAKRTLFSLKLPDGWYRDLGVKDKERLLSFSPDKDNRGIAYRAFISAGVAQPNSISLAKSPEPGKTSVHLPSTTNLSPTNRSPPKLSPPIFSNTIPASKTIIKYRNKSWVRSGLLTTIPISSHRQNGYFINIAAYPNEWAWPEFIGVIEKASTPSPLTQNDPLRSDSRRYPYRLSLCPQTGRKTRQKKPSRISGAPCFSCWSVKFCLAS